MHGINREIITKNKLLLNTQLTKSGFHHSTRFKVNRMNSVTFALCAIGYNHFCRRVIVILKIDGLLVGFVAFKVDNILTSLQIVREPATHGGNSVKSNLSLNYTIAFLAKPI